MLNLIVRKWFSTKFCKRDWRVKDREKNWVISNMRLANWSQYESLRKLCHISLCLSQYHAVREHYFDRHRQKSRVFHTLFCFPWEGLGEKLIPDDTSSITLLLHSIISCCLPQCIRNVAIYLVFSLSHMIIIVNLSISTMFHYKILIFHSIMYYTFRKNHSLAPLVAQKSPLCPLILLHVACFLSI